MTPKSERLRAAHLKWTTDRRAKRLEVLVEKLEAYIRGEIAQAELIAFLDAKDARTYQRGFAQGRRNAIQRSGTGEALQPGIKGAQAGRTPVAATDGSDRGV